MLQQTVPLQNRDHEANAFDLSNGAVVCVIGPSSEVVAAGHGCGRDGIKPLRQWSSWLGPVVDDDCPEPTWHRLMRHNTVFGDRSTSATTALAC